jgi:hypothetical protein
MITHTTPTQAIVNCILLYHSNLNHSWQAQLVFAFVMYNTSAQHQMHLFIFILLFSVTLKQMLVLIISSKLME